MTPVNERLWYQLLATAVGMVLMSSSIWACTIPVFRYALERWSPDDYSVLVFHRGPFSSEEGVAFERLQTAFPGNFVVEKVDLTGSPKKSMEQVWETQSASQLPWMVVRYPRFSGILRDAWSGPLTSMTVRNLLDSPTRKEIAKRTLAGETAVWVLLESGIEQPDEAAARLLETQLTRMEEKLEISNPGAELQDSSAYFSMVTLSRDDPLEETFLKMLLHSEPDLETLRQPMAIPIFGRGRALYVLVGDGIHEDNIERACSFLVAWCSCQVKELNPGVDLLMSVDWNHLVESQQLLPAANVEPLAEDERFGEVERRVLIVVLAQILVAAVVGSVMIWRKRRRDYSG